MQNPRLLDEGTSERPDYQRCIAISTRAALKYMVPPGALVMLAPLVAGTFFGVMAVCGLLTGKEGALYAAAAFCGKYSRHSCFMSHGLCPRHMSLSFKAVRRMTCSTLVIPDVSM